MRAYLAAAVDMRGRMHVRRPDADDGVDRRCPEMEGIRCLHLCDHFAGRNRRRGLRRAAFRERSAGRRRPPAVVRPRAHRVIARDRDSDIRGKRTCRAGIRGDRDTKGQFRCDHVDGCGAHVWRACRHGAAARRWRTHACFRDVRLAKRRKATNIRLCDYLARQRYQGL